MVHNIKFNDSTNMLIGLQDSKLLLWCYPSTAYVDKELLPKTVVQKETTYDCFFVNLKYIFSVFIFVIKVNLVNHLG